MNDRHLWSFFMFNWIENDWHYSSATSMSRPSAKWMEGKDTECKERKHSDPSRDRERRTLVISLWNRNFLDSEVVFGQETRASVTWMERSWRASHLASLIDNCAYWSCSMSSGRNAKRKQIDIGSIWFVLIIMNKHFFTIEFAWSTLVRHFKWFA